MRVGIRLTTALNNWRRESSRSEDAEDKLGPLKSNGRERVGSRQRRRLKYIYIYNVSLLNLS